jgi:hypothetical protein
MTLPWWYRVIAFVSALLWLNVLWVLGCLLVVTAPASTVALFSEAAHLIRGEGVTWRRFVAIGRAVFVPALLAVAVLAPFAALAVLAILLGGGQRASLLLGVGTVVVAVVAIAATVVTHLLAVGVAPFRAVLRRLGLALLLRPVVCVLMTAPALAVGLLLLFGFDRVAVTLLLFAGAVAAVCTETIARFPVRETSTPAARARASVLGVRPMIPTSGRN